MQTKSIITQNLIAKGIPEEAIAVNTFKVFVKKQLEDWELRSYTPTPDTYIVHRKGNNTAIKFCWRPELTEKQYQEFTDFYFGTNAN